MKTKLLSPREDLITRFFQQRKTGTKTELRDSRFIELRYDKGYPLELVGEALCITKSRAQQIEQSLKQELIEFLKTQDLKMSSLN